MTRPKTAIRQAHGGLSLSMAAATLGSLDLVTCRTCRRLNHIANAPDYTRRHWRKEMTVSAPGCVGPLYGLDAGLYCTLHRPAGHESIPDGRRTA